jgi:hypothetical protein
MMAVTFHAVLLSNGKTATGIQVPAEVVAKLGTSKKPPVKVTIGKLSFQTTVATMGGRFMLPVSGERRAAAGIAAGDKLTVTLELDTAPRVVTVPADFKKALAADAKARKFFEGLSYSHQLRHVLAIEGAKAPETRTRRIEKAVEMLRAGKK